MLYVAIFPTHKNSISAAWSQSAACLVWSGLVLTFHTDDTFMMILVFHRFSANRTFTIISFVTSFFMRTAASVACVAHYTCVRRGLWTIYNVELVFELQQLRSQIFWNGCLNGVGGIDINSLTERQTGCHLSIQLLFLSYSHAIPSPDELCTYWQKSANLLINIVEKIN